MRAIASFMLFLLVWLPLGRPAMSHEFWIEALEYQVETPGPVAARLRNGENFSGIEVAWFDGRVAGGGWRLDGAQGGYASRPGDRPALTLGAPAPGLLQMTYVSRPSVLSYADWGRFVAFVEGKGYPEAVARHRARGLPETGFKERYTRFCKALVAVGDGAGNDSAAGMEAELIALANPYADPPGDGMRIELRERGAPRPGARIDVFERDARGRVVRSSVTTDAAGRARVPVRPGRAYLLDAVILREADGAAGVVWESLWASLTFEVPQ